MHEQFTSKYSAKKFSRVPKRLKTAHTTAKMNSSLLGGIWLPSSTLTKNCFNSEEGGAKLNKLTGVVGAPSIVSTWNWKTRGGGGATQACLTTANVCMKQKTWTYGRSVSYFRFGNMYCINV